MAEKNPEKNVKVKRKYKPFFAKKSMNCVHFIRKVAGNK